MVADPTSYAVGAMAGFAICYIWKYITSGKD